LLTLKLRTLLPQVVLILKKLQKTNKQLLKVQKQVIKPNKITQDNELIIWGIVTYVIKSV
jgi:hypothetical protein